MVALLHGPHGRIVLSSSRMYMGQLQSNQIVVSDIAAAPYHHACIIPQSPIVYGIQDLGTGSHGTFVNDRRLQPNVPHWLNHGDKIRIGHTTFTYVVAQPTHSSVGAAQSPGGSIAGFIFIALIVIGLVAYFNQNSSSSAQNQPAPSSPQQTLQTFCSAVQSRNYQTAYDQLSRKTQQQDGTEQQFATKLERLFTAHKGLQNCAVSKVQTGTSTATGTITYTFLDNGTISYRDTLTDENTIWKIDSSTP